MEPKSTNEAFRNRSAAGVAFECQDELLLLFEELPGVLFCVKDAAGRYVYVNDAFLRRSGKRSKRELIGRTASDVFAPQRAEQYEAQDAEVLATGRPLHDVLELIRRPNGRTGWYITTKIPVLRTGEGLGIVTLSKDLETSTDDESEVAALSRVIDYVQSNIDQPLRTADLLAVAQCSTAQLTARLRRATGLSPSQFIIRCRVDHAMHLLVSSTLPISQVATESGFYDQANLTKQFGRYTGLTPLEVRSTRGKAVL